ncbi:hypothetical protein D3C76_1674810 [compost metagenome]
MEEKADFTGFGIFFGIVQQLLDHPENVLLDFQRLLFDLLDAGYGKIDFEFGHCPLHMKQLVQCLNQPDVTEHIRVKLEAALP